MRSRRTTQALSRILPWLTAGALAVDLLMVAGLLALVAWNGAGAFWPRPVTRLALDDGTHVLGEIESREAIPDPASGARTAATRLRMHLGNRDVSGVDFRWIEEAHVVERDRPRDAVLLERLEWGPFF